MADEKTYGEFIEDVVQLDASAHHKRRRPAKVWVEDSQSNWRWGVTDVRHEDGALILVFDSVNPNHKMGPGRPLDRDRSTDEVSPRLMRSQPGHSNPTIPGDHVLDMSTFDRRQRTATCSTCGPETNVITDLRPGMVPTEENWHCPRGREAMEVRTA